MEGLAFINWSIAIFFTVCYAYQFLYIALALLKKPTRFPDAPPHRFAVMIAARNEAAVIGQLIESIRRQEYPAELIDVFVVADNCTDATASVARRAGAQVWKRADAQKVGKGYALHFLFQRVFAQYGAEHYDGYFIFDADNLLDEHYIYEMNKAFAAGYRVVTGSRNSKNYGSNWISAGYALGFLRDGRLMHQGRMHLSTSCSVTGTGFLVHSDIIRKNGGWRHFMLSEDTEFSVQCILEGERIGYCPAAELFDEQPTSFRQSWAQRERWAKGYWQVFRKYGRRLLHGILVDKDLACFDMTMCVMPAILLTVVGLSVNTVMAVLGVLLHKATLISLLYPLLGLLGNAYVMLFLMGVCTLLGSWKQIHCPVWKKLLSLLSFPFFQLTYLPIAATAICKKIEWKPIRHDVAVSLAEVRETNR